MPAYTFKETQDSTLACLPSKTKSKNISRRTDNNEKNATKPPKQSYYKAKERRKVLTFLIEFSIFFLIEPRFSIFPTMTAQ